MKRVLIVLLPLMYICDVIRYFAYLDLEAGRPEGKYNFDKDLAPRFNVWLKKH